MESFSLFNLWELIEVDENDAQSAVCVSLQTFESAASLWAALRWEQCVEGGALKEMLAAGGVSADRPLITKAFPSLPLPAQERWSLNSSRGFNMKPVCGHREAFIAAGWMWLWLRPCSGFITLVLLLCSLVLWRYSEYLLSADVPHKYTEEKQQEVCLGLTLPKQSQTWPPHPPDSLSYVVFWCSLNIS